SLDQLQVTTKNLSGESLKVPVHLSIFPLLGPGRFIRERFWKQPDQFLISKKTYLKYFPQDEYRNERDVHFWMKKPMIWKGTLFEGQHLDPKKLILPPGEYLLRAFVISPEGDTVKDSSYVQVFDPKSRILPFPQMCWIAPLQLKVHPGGTARFLLGTSAKKIEVIQETETGQGQQVFTRFLLQRGVHEIRIPVSMADRGGKQVRLFLVKNDRIYVQSLQIQVPLENSRLTFSYSSFRDKIPPGSTEKWTIKIANQQDHGVKAEVLAGMYDASLDALQPHEWQEWSLNSSFPETYSWEGANTFGGVHSQQWGYPVELPSPLPDLNWFGYLPFPQNIRDFRIMNEMGSSPGVGTAGKNGIYSPQDSLGNASLQSAANASTGPKMSFQDPSLGWENQVLRKHFQETAFFYPQLVTQQNGELALNFTLPQSLTTWKLMLFAYTRKLSSGMDEKTIISQKSLMVLPNAPRFLREGDQCDFAVKVISLSPQRVKGQLCLQLLDSDTHLPLDSAFENYRGCRSFTLGQGQSAEISFPIRVPENFKGLLEYKVVARAGDYSDGEENILPILSKQVLVRATFPLTMNGDSVRQFRWPSLLASARTPGLLENGLTVEWSANPAWYGLLALPSLTSGPYGNAEEIFNRFDAYYLADWVRSQTPELSNILAQWSSKDTAMLEGNLEQNQFLGSFIREQTPWVRSDQQESFERNQVAQLFDPNQSRSQMNHALDLLQQLQTSQGGISWFAGMAPDRWITQNLMVGMGQLKRLKNLGNDQSSMMNRIISEAIPYLDRQIRQDVLQKSDSILPRDKILGSLQIQYLYMRSFFPDFPISTTTWPAYQDILLEAKKDWTRENIFLQGMIALSLFRAGDSVSARNILRSLRERVIRDPSRGFYWKFGTERNQWYKAPVETAALLVTAFEEISKDTSMVNGIKVWLLNQKQTHHWSGTRATADASYALLGQGADWFNQHPSVEVSLGKTRLTSPAGNTDGGPGYFVHHFPATLIQPSMGNIRVRIFNSHPKQGSNDLPFWGSLYWQYFQNSAQVKASPSPFNLHKELWVTRNTPNGPQQIQVTSSTRLRIGDQVLVRMIIQSDRGMDDVHLNDMRAACFEPKAVLSGYRYQGGLGFYATISDYSTDFFFNFLPRGTYVLTYQETVQLNGNYSNGISSMECMYAPSFTSHSSGMRVRVGGAE
ncbi:MAG: alpha-2-macroglobulin family protein, partial [Chitinophagaceae bacterium]